VLIAGLFAIMGQALTCWVDFGFFYAQKSAVSWRFPIAFQGVFAIAVVSLVTILPESPRWLIKRDRAADATEILSQLEDVGSDSTHVAREIANIQQSLLDDNAVSSRSPFSMSEHRHLHRTILAVGCTFLAQVVCFISPVIMNKTNQNS
jgi:hypothetical protein